MPCGGSHAARNGGPTAAQNLMCVRSIRGAKVGSQRSTARGVYEQWKEREGEVKLNGEIRTESEEQEPARTPALLATGSMVGRAAGGRICKAVFVRAGSRERASHERDGRRDSRGLD